MRPFETLRYDLSPAGVATIALDRPDTRNALSDELYDDLPAAAAQARDDGAVGCVVVTSTHPTTFCAGGRLDTLGGDVPLVERHAAAEKFPNVFAAPPGELGFMTRKHIDDFRRAWEHAGLDVHQSIGEVE